ncbi:TetR/AcrR family transcriptional regulator [Paracoccus shanxieyensis]|uniref:Uncharacterized protein n=1 Tax=Paracoccus shanxieyensis TaxID=2675752 RepID=A0A6L6IVH4_9RHOB|nr:WHG domain-containing protein [Paracoccus shanxieyensis]MTH64223.1 hypothetical protein [Paracoccus shanxieyensis]MTH87367.1 hypothetical protein [Paracoccus shanxieyensis]
MPHTGQQGRTLHSRAVIAATEFLTDSGRIPPLPIVAEHLEVTPEALFGIFSSEQHLLEAVAENALMRLHDQCVRTVVAVEGEDPVAQFHALADAYLEWAYLHPREFRIIGLMPDAEFRENERLIRYENSIHELMLRLLTRAKAMGRLSPDENLPLLIAVAHAYSYGVASKMLLGDMSRWAPGINALEIARAAMHIFTQKVLRP